MPELAGERIAVLAAKGVEQVVDGDIHPSTTIPVDVLVGDVSPDGYDGLLLPGGAVNPALSEASCSPAGDPRPRSAGGRAGGAARSATGPGQRSRR